MLKKISFKKDYSEGCHPRILTALQEHNLSQQAGYGTDDFCIQATQFILEKANAPQAKIHFVSGGTQANLLVASALLKPYESVISAKSGHIYDNEAGAIESTGHKVNAIAGANGKLRPQDIQEVLEAHTNKPHQLKQKLVYISNTTEIGTHYTKAELEGLSAFCKSQDLYLFMDGARLGNALMAESNDLTLADIAKLTDVFYIGGTKNGALMGEAIVFTNPDLQEDFGFFLKQKGALLSKGRLFGIQFLELFKDNLYFELAQYANKQAMAIKDALVNLNVEFWSDTETNQIFPILKNSHILTLQEQFDFYVWKKIDDHHSAVRIITSWATPDEHIAKFIQVLNQLK